MIIRTRDLPPYQVFHVLVDLLDEGIDMRNLAIVGYDEAGSPSEAEAVVRQEIEAWAETVREAHERYPIQRVRE
jgi:hypothetical protein